MKPIKVNALDLAFGGKMEKLLPSMNDIPEEFRKGENKWNDIVSYWFSYGLKNCKWYPKEGIETEDALRHIQAIMVSFEPKHEHKEAGCAYLLSQFFDDLEYARET